MKIPKDRENKSSESLIKPPAHERLASRWDSLSLGTWFYEFLALCFSVACFIAIFVILHVYDGKTTPKLSHGLTLNTIISVLSTASKSSLTFAVGESILSSSRSRRIPFASGRLLPTRRPSSNRTLSTPGRASQAPSMSESGLPTSP